MKPAPEELKQSIRQQDPFIADVIDVMEKNGFQGYFVNHVQQTRHLIGDGAAEQFITDTWLWIKLASQFCPWMTPVEFADTILAVAKEKWPGDLLRQVGLK